MACKRARHPGLRHVREQGVPQAMAGKRAPDLTIIFIGTVKAGWNSRNFTKK